MQELNNIAQLNCFKISAKQTLNSNSVMPVYMHVYLLPDILKDVFQRLCGFPSL